MKNNILITLAGWEERFLNAPKLLKDKIDGIILLRVSKYNDLTSDNVKALYKLSDKIIEKEIKYDTQVDIFTSLDNIEELKESSNEYIVDLSTMTREISCFVFSILKNFKNKVDYVYTKPSTYGDNWLAKDYKKPRLLLKHSGIFDIDKPTLLFVITGFDIQRAQGLLNFIKPDKLIIARQQGDEYNNIIRNNDIDKLDMLGKPASFDVNCYDVDECLTAMEEKINPHLNDYNIIISSMGPKISTISVYKYHLLHTDTAIAYMPCNQYNENYSSGTRDCLDGMIELS